MKTNLLQVKKKNKTEEGPYWFLNLTAHGHLMRSFKNCLCLGPNLQTVFKFNCPNNAFQR